MTEDEAWDAYQTAYHRSQEADAERLAAWDRYQRIAKGKPVIKGTPAAKPSPMPKKAVAMAPPVSMLSAGLNAARGVS